VLRKCVRSRESAVHLTNANAAPQSDEQLRRPESTSTLCDIWTSVFRSGPAHLPPSRARIGLAPDVVTVQAPGGLHQIGKLIESIGELLVHEHEGHRFAAPTLAPIAVQGVDVQVLICLREAQDELVAAEAPAAYLRNHFGVFRQKWGEIVDWHFPPPGFRMPC